ncbi:sugar porter family MFS transporter [Pelagicoccus mobilis]|uniref:Sugar porter family MFS transporter n=2 Tax=Pelagicoccus mobilis TaxID=415221 RepID=A0A934RX06_9BACT|nr:sugar porter family MFS transporter [Pelagicoccus mobilis]
MNNRKLYLWSVTSALAGFLFGFDTVVISGAEQTIEKLWQLSPTMHGLAMSAALWGTVLGALIGAWPAERFGRRNTLLGIGVLYFTSAVGSALAPEEYTFMFARFIGGIGVGISTVAAPMYIAEIAPAHLRGRLAGMFQFNIVFGILIAFVSNAALANIGDNAWRWMLGIEALPAIVYTALCFLIPESPRWLITKRNKSDEAIETLAQTHPGLSKEELLDKAHEIATSKPTGPKASFWRKELKRPILLAFLIAFFNQLSGINAILYFAPRIFEKTGLGESAALLQSVGIGVTNLIFTFVGLYLIDRLGRRTLLYLGSIGYILSLGACSVAFFTENFSIVPICIFAFIAAHAIGQGAVIWVFIGEIFPNSDRASGQALGSFTHWIFAASLTLVFPFFVTKFPAGYVFGFFCLMMVIQLLWVRFFVPETKGVSLERIQALFAQKR